MLNWFNRLYLKNKYTHVQDVPLVANRRVRETSAARPYEYSALGHTPIYTLPPSLHWLFALMCTFLLIYSHTISTLPYIPCPPLCTGCLHWCVHFYLYILILYQHSHIYPAPLFALVACTDVYIFTYVKVAEDLKHLCFFL